MGQQHSSSSLSESLIVYQTNGFVFGFVINKFRAVLINSIYMRLHRYAHIEYYECISSIHLGPLFDNHPNSTFFNRCIIYNWRDKKNHHYSRFKRSSSVSCMCAVHTSELRSKTIDDCNLFLLIFFLCGSKSLKDFNLIFSFASSVFGCDARSQFLKPNKYQQAAVRCIRKYSGPVECLAPFLSVSQLSQYKCYVWWWI